MILENSEDKIKTADQKYAAKLINFPLKTMVFNTM